MKKKVVIANSVGIDKEGNYIIHSPSRWTVGVKEKYNWFCYYPWELAYLSSLLKKRTDFDITLVDGCLEQLNQERFYNKLVELKPDWLVMESSSRTIMEDLELANMLKADLGTKLIFTGQHPTAYPDEVLDAGADFVCIGEYEFSVLELLQKGNNEGVLGIHPNERRQLIDINELPFPEDHDISRMDYATPGEPNCDYREIQMYASRGCRMGCTFCVAGNLYYPKPNWRPRKVESVIEEISMLKNKYPRMEGVFFDEETHNGEKKFVMELCKGIIDNGLQDLKYNAMCGYWTMDKDVLGMMAEAGYYKLRFGIETASEKVSKEMKKPIDVSKISDVLKTAKSFKIKTYGTFTIGAPGSDKIEDQKTVDLIESLTKDDVLNGLQISITTPQPGTPFFKWAEDNGYLQSYDWNDYDGATCAVVSYPDYSSDEIEKMFRKACDVRDHYVFKKKLTIKDTLVWFKRNVQDYGFSTAVKKGFSRLLAEFSFGRK